MDRSLRRYWVAMFQAALLALALTASPTPALGVDAAPRSLDAPTTCRVHSASLIPGGLSSDRAAHVLGGFWSAGAGYAFATHRGWDPADRRLAALAVAATASVAKELFDDRVQHEPFSVGDLLADGVGAAAFLAVAALAGP